MHHFFGPVAQNTPVQYFHIGRNHVGMERTNAICLIPSQRFQQGQHQLTLFLQLETRLGHKITWNYYREGFRGSKGALEASASEVTCARERLARASSVMAATNVRTYYCTVCPRPVATESSLAFGTTTRTDTQYNRRFRFQISTRMVSNKSHR